MTEPVSSLVSGTHQVRALGDYVILAELARGGMGRVYLARKSGQAGFARLFAIKVMSHQLEDDREALLMLLDEAHIASRLHHPNVVSVLDIGTADGGYYLVMDYVEGGSLHELLRRQQGARPARLVVAIVLEALHGLHAVHGLADGEGKPYGVVHRDVSPHNLLVGLDGGCRVIDFGIAKASARLTDTQAGVHKGKLAYMAPEQMRGESDLDRRVDVWAAGVTLYVGLTGHHPFRSANDASTIHNVLTAEIPPPSTFGAPACLDAVVMKALERRADDRWETAQAFGDALRRTALANDLLGSPAEVAAWVSEALGDDLSKRRRMVHAVSSGDPMTRSGKVPALPRLWGSPDGTSSGASAVGPASGERPTASRAPWVIAAGIGLLVGLAALIVPTWLEREGREEPTREEGPPAIVETPVEAPPPPEEVTPSPTLVAPTPVPERTEVVAAPSDTPIDRSAPSRWRRRPGASHAVAHEETAPPVAREEPPPVAAAPVVPRAAPPPPVAPAAPASSLESNPYMRGE